MYSYYNMLRETHTPESQKNFDKRILVISIDFAQDILTPKFED